MTRKDLIAAFGETKGAAVADLLTGKTDFRTHPAVVSWAEKCDHDPRENPRSRAECVLLAVDAELEGFGVESISGRFVDRYHGEIQACYVNLGDTYTATILHDNEKGRYLLTSWGDWVERNERRRQIA